MDIEDLINQVNTTSKTNVFKYLALFSLSFVSVYHFGHFQLTLLSLVTPHYNCTKWIKSNVTQNNSDQCFRNIEHKTFKQSEQCTKWWFSPEPIGETVITSFSLVCSSIKYKDLIILYSYCVSIIGFFFGSLADKFGRKPVLLVNLLIETISTFCLVFSPNLITFMIIITIINLCSSTLYVAYIWLIEIVDSKSRNFIGAFFPLFGCAAGIFYPLTVYFLRSWKLAKLCVIIPSFMYLTVLFIPESPRWLIVSGQNNKAFDSLKSIAKINGIFHKINWSKLLISQKYEAEEISFIEAFKSKIFLKRSILMFILHFSIYLFYSAVVINIHILSENIFISIFFITSMELPGLILSYILLSRINRKQMLLITTCITSCLFVLTVFITLSTNYITNTSWRYFLNLLRILLGSIGMACLVSSDQVTVVFASELFPTAIRSFVGVYIQIADNTGFILSVFTNKLSNIFLPLPMILYATLLSSITLIIYNKIPETKDSAMPETLSDLTDNVRQRKYSKLPNNY